MSSEVTKGKITELERRIAELKKRNRHPSSGVADKEAEETIASPKISLTPFQKIRLYASVALTILSTLHIILAESELGQSMVLGIFSAVYTVIFHMPVDWLSGLLDFTVPRWVKDVTVFMMSGLIALNALTLRDMGKSYWSTLASEADFPERGFAGKPIEIFTRAALMIYTVIFMVFAAPMLVIAYLYLKRKGEAESLKPLVSIAYACFIIILLVIAALVVNSVFLMVGA